MNRRKTVLVFVRGTRLLRLFQELVVDLARDHRVVVLVWPEQLEAFSSLEGVEVWRYENADNPSATKTDAAWSMSDEELRARAREIELETGLRLYKAASNYLLYGRIVKSYGGWWSYLETERDMLSAYVGAYLQLSTIFEEVKPDVVYYETIDIISTYVAFTLAYRRGIFALDTRFSPLTDGKVSTGFGLHRKNIVLEYLYAHRGDILPSSFAAADEMMNRPRQYLLDTTYARINRNLMKGNSPFNLARLVPLLSDWRAVARAIRNRRWHLYAARNRIWLWRNLTREIPKQAYIVFYPSNMPEASTSAQAPRWVDQEVVVEQLAINAPSHLKIVVKEHPNTYGTRGRDFFQRLKDLPNVVLCHPAVDSHALLSGAKAVVAITGTLGLEGILLGKRVGVLGRPFYSVYKGVKTLNYPEEIYDAMEDPAWRPEEMGQETRDFLAAYIQSSHEFGHGGKTDIFPPTGGDKWAGALRQTMNLIDTHKLKPSDFDTALF